MHDTRFTLQSSYDSFGYNNNNNAKKVDFSLTEVLSSLEISNITRLLWFSYRFTTVYVPMYANVNCTSISSSPTS